MKELLHATNNFNESNKLGEGGFGTVYWGKTKKGVEVTLELLVTYISCLDEYFFIVQIV